MGTVTYAHARAQDVLPEIQQKMQHIADVMQWAIYIYSGMRYGGGGSLHDHHRAVDFQVTGLTFAQVFSLMIQRRALLFPGGMGNWVVIYHSPRTVTEGEHVHLGLVPPQNTHGWGAGFLREDQPGMYTQVQLGPSFLPPFPPRRPLFPGR